MQNIERDLKLTNKQRSTGRIALIDAYNPTVLYRKCVFAGIVHDDSMVTLCAETGLMYTGGCCDCAHTTPVSCNCQFSSVVLLCELINCLQ